MTYKIQIGWEDGFYVAYLAQHTDNLNAALVVDELQAFEIEDLMDMIPVHWKEKLTNFLNN